MALLSKLPPQQPPRHKCKSKRLEEKRLCYILSSSGLEITNMPNHIFLNKNVFLKLLHVVPWKYSGGKLELQVPPVYLPGKSGLLTTTNYFTHTLTTVYRIVRRLQLCCKSTFMLCRVCSAGSFQKRATSTPELPALQCLLLKSWLHEKYGESVLSNTGDLCSPDLFKENYIVLGSVFFNICVSTAIVHLGLSIWVATEETRLHLTIVSGSLPWLIILEARTTSGYTGAPPRTDLMML